jgi:hypothetical protein
MGTVLELKNDGAVARPPHILVPLIKDDLKQAHEAAQRAGLPYYRAAGEKMIEAKAQLKHGEFGPWIKRNFGISQQHASRYMAYAHATADTQNSRAREFSTFSEFMREEGGDPSYGKVVRKQPWHEPVKQIINKVDVETLNIKRDELKRADERGAQRQLALQLIDIGYKALASKLHPDKGGSRDAMARLNQVRERLKASA